MSLELKEIIILDDPPPPYEPIREKRLQWKKPVFLIVVVLTFVLLIGVAIGAYQLLISRSAPVPVGSEPPSNFTKEKLGMTEIRVFPTNATSSSATTTAIPIKTIITQATVAATKELKKETTSSPTTTTLSTKNPTTATTKIKTPSTTTTTSDEYEYEDENLETDVYEEDLYELPAIEINQPITSMTTTTTAIITTGEPLIPWHQWDARDQEATVEGVLLCDGHPARGVRIKMYEKDTFTADDKLAEVNTDGNGQFRITGHSRELPGVRMKVHINFYHHCKRPLWELCDNKSTLRVPNDFITSKGERPKVFQVGRLDLAKIAYNRDCFN